MYPDRIETATFYACSCDYCGEIMIKNVVPDHVKPITAKLVECGVEAEITEEGLYVNAADKKTYSNCDLLTLPYPDFHRYTVTFMSFFGDC